MWLQYIGLPYLDFGRTCKGVDCWGLVLLILKEQYNIIIPEFPYTSTDANTVFKVASEVKLLGHKVETPCLGDIAVFNITGGHLHAAFVLDSMLMLHVERGLRGSVVESYHSPRWLPRLEGVYRYG